MLDDDFSCPNWLESTKCNHDYVISEDRGEVFMQFSFYFLDGLSEETVSKAIIMPVIRKSRFCIKCQLGNTKIITTGGATQVETWQ